MIFISSPACELLPWVHRAGLLRQDFLKPGLHSLVVPEMVGDAWKLKVTERGKHTCPLITLKPEGEWHPFSPRSVLTTPGGSLSLTPLPLPFSSC